MINQAPRRHKWSGPLTLALLALAACGGGDADTGAEGVAAAPGLPCPVVVDTSGWLGFKDLAARLEAGVEVPRDELEALAATPAFRRWVAAFPDRAPTPLHVANWLEAAFLPPDPDEPRKRNPDRREFERSYRWSWQERAEVDRRLAALADGGWCAFHERVAAWLPDGSRPDTLFLHVLPTKPLTRFHAGRLFVDTGVVAASTTTQLRRMLCAHLHRNLAAIDGPNPLETDGEVSVANLFRLVVNEGVAGWLEDQPHTVFAREHPVLNKVRLVPEEYWRTALQRLPALDAALADALADPERMAARGQSIARSFGAGGLVGQGSWCMATTIAATLGEARLRAVSGSVPGFIAAYQEAALAQPEPRPALQDVPGAYHRTMPAFSPEVMDGLMELLRRHFPDDG